MIRDLSPFQQALRLVREIQTSALAGHRREALLPRATEALILLERFSQSNHLSFQEELLQVRSLLAQERTFGDGLGTLESLAKQIQEKIEGKKRSDRFELSDNRPLSLAESTLSRLWLLSAMTKSGAKNKIQSLLRKLGKPYENSWDDALLEIVDIGEPAVEPLIQALADSDLNVRLFAAKALRILSSLLTNPS